MFEQELEGDLIINGRELKYKGIFRADELFFKINRLIEEKGYEKREKKTEEVVTETGRKTFVELRPYKEKSEYYYLMLKIRIFLDNISEVVEEFKGEKRKFQQGDVEIIFDAWFMADLEHRWNMKPAVFFLRGFINKFIHKFPFEKECKRELMADTAYFYGQIKKFLNSYKYEVGKGPKEADVMRSVEEEVRREI